MAKTLPIFSPAVREGSKMYRKRIKSIGSSLVCPPAYGYLNKLRGVIVIILQPDHETECTGFTVTNE